ncbi:MAG: amidoligase family protein [Clostridia bacterium]
MDNLLCDMCNHEILSDEPYRCGERELCEDCYNEHTFVCDHCREVTLTRFEVSDARICICETCYDNHYVRCSECDELILQDDACYENSDYDEVAYCRDCYDSGFGPVIHDYYYKPEPIFFGDDKRYFGIELEIDGAGTIRNNAQKILNTAKSDTIYIKRDGSLDDGLEIVSHPMTYEFHQNDMNWLDILNCCLNMRYTSHKAGTCGLHIHVNKIAFGETREEQEKVISKILYFVEKHWSELLNFSRRTEHQLTRWANRYGYEDKPQEILEKAKKGQVGRYVCVNISNFHTVEFRIFRGTLKFNTFIATLQLVNKICDVAISLSEEEITNLSFASFVETITETELIAYLKERNLYINETIEVTEEK